MDDNKKTNSQKTATDNKWISTGVARPHDKSERKDGPGGEDADESNRGQTKKTQTGRNKPRSVFFITYMVRHNRIKLKILPDIRILSFF